MRVGVIRGDLSGPVFLADLEPTSQINYPVDPVAQTRYISRPNVTAITNFLAGVYASDYEDGSPAVTLPIPTGKFGAGGVPAGVQSVSAVTFSVTIVSSGSPNNILRLKTTSTGSYTAVTVANGVYATMAALVAAVNAGIKQSGVAATATQDSTGTKLVIQSNTPGVGSFIGIDTVGNGSTFNASTAGNFGSGGLTFTMPSAATIIAALNPVVVPPATGSINVSSTAIMLTLGAAPAAQNIANLIAPQFQETEVAIQSFQVGNLAGYLLPTFVPDPHRVPAMTAGPAIQVLQNDGASAFSAPLPMITAAVHNSPNTGDITITGVGLGVTEFTNETTVIVTAASSPTGTGAPPFVSVNQKLINHTLSGGTQGSVTPTSIVIPASILKSANGTALGVAGSTVELKFESFANTNYGTAATISSVSSGVVTLTGLTHQYPSQVGGYIVLSNCAIAANNGRFKILSYVSATSITISNVNAIAGDSNNGSIVWSEPTPVAFVVT